MLKILLEKKNNLLICEGYMDVISLHQNGIKSIVAPLGTSLTEDQLILSWKYSSKPTIMFDGDNAGIRASYKSAIMALPFISAKNFLQFINLPNGYDPDTYINELSLVSLIEESILTASTPAKTIGFHQESLFWTCPQPGIKSDLNIALTGRFLVNVSLLIE